MSARVNKLLDAGSDTRDQIQRASAPAVKEAKRQAGHLVDETNELLEAAQGQVIDTAADLGKRLVAFTKKSPWTALLLAAGAGALVLGAFRILRSRR